VAIRKNRASYNSRRAAPCNFGDQLARSSFERSLFQAGDRVPKIITACRDSPRKGRRSNRDVGASPRRPLHKYKL
jgi:hypothetical protein